MNGIYLMKFTVLCQNLKMSKHSGHVFWLFFLNLCTNFLFSPLMLNIYCYIGHRQFANCQSYTKNANINVVPESPCTYWAGWTNALVNCYLQSHAGAGYEKCIQCEMSTQSLRPITVNHWLRFTGIQFHS